ncbi:MAG: RsmD family RNA methyltransferase [Candidatus Micrarchaeia archaeon]
MYKEGSAMILKHENAFLNPKGRASREISLGIAKLVYKGGEILDATAATGIRGIEYSARLDAKVTMLEINKTVYEELSENLKYNYENGVIKKKNVQALNESFQRFANTTEKKFEIIDIDPFGGAAPYVYDAMKLVSDSSYLFVTATDVAVLCGAHRNACLKLYGAVPMHNEFCHEAGIRILLGYIAKIAAQFNYGIAPVISLYYAHYMRVFVRLEHGAKNAMASIGKLGYAHYCDKCGNRHSEVGMFPKERKCEVCGSDMNTAGVMWIGSIKDDDTAKKVYEHLQDGASKEAKNILERIVEEIDMPFYYSIPHLTKKLAIGSINRGDLMAALSRRGKVSKTHFDYSSIKTDVPYKDIIDITKMLYEKREQRK